MGLMNRIPCCREKSYCYEVWHTTPQQKKSDPDWDKTKIAWVSAALFLVLAIVFAGLLLRPQEASARKYLICFATFMSLAPLPPIIRNCTCFAEVTPPPRKKKESSSDSDSSESSDDGKL